jgi:hypothetical protein
MMRGRNEIRAALAALDDDLAGSAVKASIFIVGGAAMAIAYDARRSTVDAVFAPTGEVREAARRVAERLGLSDDWINDGAKAFLRGDDPDRITDYEGATSRWRPRPLDTCWP